MIKTETKVLNVTHEHNMYIGEQTYRQSALQQQLSCLKSTTFLFVGAIFYLIHKEISIICFVILYYFRHEEGEVDIDSYFPKAGYPVSAQTMQCFIYFSIRKASRKKALFLVVPSSLGVFFGHIFSSFKKVLFSSGPAFTSPGPSPLQVVGPLLEELP